MELFKKILTKHSCPNVSGWYDTNKDRLYWFSDKEVWSCRQDRVSEEFPAWWLEAVAKDSNREQSTQSTWTRYFNVSYVFNKNGLGYGNTNITATGDNGPYMEKLKVLEIISESSGAPVNSIVISNIIEMNESDYKQWIR